MKAVYSLLCLLMLAGCGSGGNVDAVTPILGDIRGTYRLAFSTVSVTAPDGVTSSFASYSTGTLQLFENSTYVRTILSTHGPAKTQGNYQFAASTSSILGSRHGTFSFSELAFGPIFTGVYDVTSDFYLTLTSDRYTLPDASQVTRSTVWLKESDSPYF